MRTVLVLALLLPCACGPKTPPPALEQPVANASAPAPPANPPPGDAGLDAAPSEPIATIASATASATPPPPSDACTPIGVALEKSVRPKLRACYREGKKKDPDLQGALKITIDIDTLGKVKDTRVHDSTLPKPVGDCMLKVIKDAKLTPAESGKCPGKSITIPMAFPTPK